MKTKRFIQLLFSALVLFASFNPSLAQQQPDFLMAKYVSNGLSPTIVQTIKLQANDPQEQRKLLKDIGDHKFFYTLIYNTKTQTSCYKLDSINKVEGIVPAGNSVFVLVDAEGNFHGKETFTGDEYYFSGNKGNLEWEITDEKKQIGQYSCTKANLKNLTGTSVWFTTDIPVSAGPDIYQGLPGLVLEVEAVFEKTDLQSVSFSDAPEEHNAEALDAAYAKSKPLPISQVFSLKNNFIQMVKQQLETGKK
ncbi:GLPGLI family protein [Parapedobacter koreensis]|uniref:GLPGLI family protein n=1 Tax=Parapedobacter koreensis TaxID=332977 RepID=A0A1H7JMS8_9SPHI|nr:GLPGLI family protein [Parapedobacter koreensis]SEK75871.1 GLPGLI family protein [Parapedobacter koreensis]